MQAMPRYGLKDQKEHALGVKDWEPLLELPEPGPARCSCPGCPGRAPLEPAAAEGDLPRADTTGVRGTSMLQTRRVFPGAHA